MGFSTRGALWGIGLLLLTCGSLQAQWWRYESDRIRYMQEARQAPRTPRSQFTTDQYRQVEWDRQERWLNNAQRRRESLALQRLSDEQQAATLQERGSQQLHERDLQAESQAFQAQRQQHRLLHDERLQRARQNHELRMQELQHQHELRRSVPETTAPPPVDYRGHGS